MVMNTHKNIETLFPFQRNYLKRNGHTYHYLNEGQGEPVIMLHGNPSWSFYYRNLVKALRNEYQCIVPDHIGCGFSSKPSDKNYNYCLKSRIDDLEALLDSLNIHKNITLIVHDWGGMIGMGYAQRHPDRIKRLVILNTSAFHLPASKKLPLALFICRNMYIGTLLVRGLNAFSSVASYIGVKRKPMPKNIRAAYVMPFNSWRNRISTLRFIQDIPLHQNDKSYSLVSKISESVTQFKNTPTLICWGMQDFVFDKHFLTLWKEKMPHAQINEFADCGHYILEDASAQVIPLITKFLKQNL